MWALNPADVRGRTSERASLRARLQQELEQLLGLRKLRLRVYGHQDQEILRLDHMISERRRSLLDLV